MQVSGSAHPTVSVYKARLIIPGKTIMNNGKILMYPAKIVPPWACDKDLAASALCTIILI
jgi:hypothetical protein